MALEYKATFTIPKIPLFTGDPAKIIQREIAREVRAIVETLATETKQHTPVFSGNLRDSIFATVDLGEKADVTGRVGSGKQAPYARFVEEGTRPHFPPVGALRLWAGRVLGDERLAFVVARAISRRGSRGRFMFRNAWRQIAPSIGRRLQAAMDRAARTLEG